MTTLSEKAYAKINLTLDITGKRDDGYHDIYSIMQSVSLHDEVKISLNTGKDWSVHCTDAQVPCDCRNLSMQAAKLFFAETGIDPNGISIHIENMIPAQAGIGGGSADAAAVLRSLNAHYGSVFSTHALADLGARIGSDVPFCVVCGTAIAEGRGERLRKLPDMPACHIVICKPPVSCSTPILYQMYDEKNVIPAHPDPDSMLRAISTGDISGIAGNLYNVFEPIVLDNYGIVREVLADMNRAGALGSRMSGSGSSVYGIFDNTSRAEKAADFLAEKYGCGYLCQTVRLD